MGRFDPPYQQAKNIIDSGDLGAVLYVNASTRNVSSPGISSNELLTNIAIHELDVMGWLFGAEWNSISVNTPRPTRHGGSGVSDPIVLTGSLDSGAFVVADIFANNHYGYDVRTEISLEDGLIRIGVAGDLSVVREHRLPGSEPFDMVDNWIPRFTSAYTNELKAWTATLRGEFNSDLATVADGLVAISVLERLIH